MFKTFSKTIITLVLALTIFGAFAPWNIKIYAAADCSSITNTEAKGYCNIYNENAGSNNPPFVDIERGEDGEIDRYFPDGKIMQWNLLQKGTWGRSNLYTVITRNPDGSEMIVDQKTGKIIYKDKDGKVTTRQTAALNNDNGWLVFAKNWGGNMASLAKDAVAKGVMVVYSVLTQIILIPILSMLFRISAALLDFSIQTTLSTDLLKSGGVASGITDTWMIIRDICNITFIFILLYTAIKTILGIAGTDTKKMIAGVITAALLINFSLFITKVIIDAGNILGVSLYNMIGIEEGVGLGSKIMQEIGISGLWQSVDGSDLSIFSPAFAIISTLQIIFLLISFIVFMYITILFIVRIVMLIFLMAMSPIGFMGDIIPKLKEYSKMWWENLYGMVFVAPIFLLFIYLILLIAGSFNTLSNEVVGENDELIAYTKYFKYIIVIILLLTAVKMTKKMSGEMGKMAEKFGGMAVGAALGAATGGAAFALRQTAGKSANKFLNSDEGADLKERANKGDYGARMRLAYMNKAANSTFDARNTKTGKLVGKGFDKVGKNLGLAIPSMGKGGGVYSKDGKQTGFAGAQKAADDKLTKEARSKQSTEAEIAAGRAAEVARDSALTHTADYTTAERKKKDLLDVSANADLINHETDVFHAEQAQRSARTAEEKAQAAANLIAIKQKRDEKKRELIEAARIANKDKIEEQEKIMKEEKNKAIENWKRGLSKEDKKKYEDTMNRANRRDTFIKNRIKNKEQADRVRKAAGKERDTGQEAIDRIKELEDLVRGIKP